MSNPKRKFRGTDRAQSFFRAQREIDEAEFAAIEARYRKEVYTHKDGSQTHVVTAVKPVVARLPPKMPSTRSNKPDDIFEIAYADDMRRADETRETREAVAEARQALRDRGVTFQREPKSINAKVPQGRIGSIPRPKSPTKRKDADNRSIQTPDRSIDDYLSRKGLTPQKGHR